MMRAVAEQHGDTRVFCALAMVGLLAATGGCQREASATTGVASASAPQKVAAPAQEIDPCALLTPAEAGEYLGAPATPKHSTALPQVSSCIWQAFQPLRGLLIMVSTPAQLKADKALTDIGRNTIESRFQQLTQQAPPDKASPIMELGDAALWRHDLRQLWIMKKEQALITISFHNGDMTYALERSKSVAKKVLARL